MHLTHAILLGLQSEATGHVLRIQHLTTDFNISSSMSGMMFTNKGATGTVQFNLPVSPHPGVYFVFCIRAQQQEMRINPPDNGAIIINSAALADGNYLWGNNANMTVMLYSDGDNSNDWIAVEPDGMWTEQS